MPVQAVLHRRETGVLQDPDEAGQLPERHRLRRGEAVRDVLDRQAGRDANRATLLGAAGGAGHRHVPQLPVAVRSEEHTSELQSLMRNSYAVFCLKKKILRRKRDLLTTAIDLVQFIYAQTHTDTCENQCYYHINDTAIGLQT